MVEVHNFPVLDFSNFSTDFASFAEDLYQASNRWGFFILTGTEVQNVYRMFELSRAFFDMPAAQKMEKMLNEDSIGYDGPAKTTFAACEGVSFGTTPGNILETDNLPSWWDNSKREEIEQFKSQCYELSMALMSCFADRLDIPRNFFTESHSHNFPGDTLKLIKYPKLKSTNVAKNASRLAEHTDWGTLTFVFTTQGGLEIRDPEGRWFEVPVIPDGIVVNIGDVLSLWSRKALKSTMHRITWENFPFDKDRYSIGYFINPNYDAPMRSPKDEGHNPIVALTYRDYYKIRQRLTYGALEDEATGKRLFGDLDQATLEVVRSLGVANAGTLESHAISA